PLIHPADEAEKLDRVEVVDGLCLSLEAVQGIIAGHDEKVVDAESVEGIQDRLDLVSVFVFTGKMNDGLDSHPAEFDAYHVGGEGRVAPGVIGDREGMDKPPLGGLLGKAEDLILAFPARPPAGNQLHRVDKPVTP